MTAAVAETLAYYDLNAAAYFAETAKLDNSALLGRFFGHIGSSAGWVADIGCGSGRDLKAIAEAGYHAIGVEPAPALAQLAREFSGCPVIAKTVSELTEFAPKSLVGAWACSSLLHIPATALLGTFARIHAWLVEGGVLYTCFKDGDGETKDPRGRTFTNISLSDLVRLGNHAGFEVLEAFATESIVPGRIQIWNNVFLRRAAGN